MKNSAFKFVGALALSAVVCSFSFGAQKPNLQIKQNILTFSSNSEVKVKNILVNDGQCEVLRYVINYDKLWDETAKKTENSVEAQFAGAFKESGFHKMMLKETLDKHNQKEEIYSVEPITETNDFVKDFYDSAFPKSLRPNKLSKYKVNCKNITKEELMTDKDSFTYEFQQ